MKKHIPDIAALSIIFSAVAVFFLRLFWPVPQLIITPDFGRSDAWHFSFGMKYALWESLHQGKLPLWDSRIGGGFPLLAEGQTGALFFPNIVLFSQFGPAAAYNLALVLSFLTLAWGMYWCVRVFGFGRLPAVFGALTFTFSALPVLHLTHITLLQSMSLLPVLLVLTELMIRKGNPFVWIGLWTIVASQQIFAGFPQAVFLSFILSGTYALWRAVREKSFLPVIYLGAAIILGIGGAMAQLLPSWEFLQESTHPTGFDPKVASLYSMPLSHLMTYLSPFALGNPKLGTYPPFYQFDGSIFWENTAYVGLLPLVFVIMALWAGKRRTFTRFWFMVAAASLTLAWGKYSPLYFLYGFWPMTLFRVPSRFLWITTVSLIILSLSGLQFVSERIKRGRASTILLFILVGHTVLLMSTFWNYHLLVPADSWLTPPPSVAHSNGRTLTVGEAQQYARVLEQKGWQETEPFWFLRSALSPNSNIVWNISHHEALSGRALRKTSLTHQLLNSTIAESETAATMSAASIRYLDMFGIESVRSFLPIDSSQMQKIESLTDEDMRLIVYRNPNPMPRAYMALTATSAATVAQAVKILAEDSSIPHDSVLVADYQIKSNPPIQSPASDAPKPVRILSEDPQSITLEIEKNPSAGLLVLTDTDYPGWIALLDGKEVPIITANLSQRAVFVPEGSHIVTFLFDPPTVRWGIRISIILSSITTALMVFPFAASWLQIRKKTAVHAPGHPRSRGR